MIFEANQDYYQLLEIEQSASSQEIKSAYLKIKSAYRKDNLALYGMLDSLECDSILEKIEEAYATLSSSDARKDYDQQRRYDEPMRMDNLIGGDSEISSIDRVPPMESSDDTDLLSPPMTDFSESAAVTVAASESPAPAAEVETIEKAAPVAAPTPAPPPLDEWNGITLRKVRETKRLSLDEVSSLTRISKTYLQAIEDETFDKLPAPVFVRGFLIQYAKILKLQPDLVAANYMSRFRKIS